MINTRCSSIGIKSPKRLKKLGRMFFQHRLRTDEIGTPDAVPVLHVLHQVLCEMEYA